MLLICETKHPTFCCKAGLVKVVLVSCPLHILMGSQSVLSKAATEAISLEISYDFVNNFVPKNFVAHVTKHTCLHSQLYRIASSFRAVG